MSRFIPDDDIEDSGSMAVGGGNSNSSSNSNSNRARADSGDYVVEEMDVYLVDNLSLNLLQYPLKPVYGEDNFSMTSVKHRPLHSKLEYEVPYPENNSSKNTNFGLGEDPDDDAGEQQLITASVVPTTNLGICIVKDGALHINPIKTVYQMRPSFRNIKTKGEVIEAPPAPVEVKEERAIVQVKKREGDKPYVARTLTYTQVLLQEEKEPWITLKFNDLSSAESRKDLSQLVAK